MFNFHDAHATMPLGAAKLLHERRHKLKGTVKLVFQPAEEGKAGAFHVLKEGALDNVQGFLGLHVSPHIPAATIASRPAPMLASSGRFLVTIRAKGGHAAFPHLNKDPVLAASMAIIVLQQIIQRETDPLQPKLGFVERNHTGNLIPEKVEFGGTFRSFTAQEQSYIQKRIREVIEMQAVVYGCSGTVDFMEDRMMPYPPTVNDEALYEHNKRVGEALLGRSSTWEAQCEVFSVYIAAEDFSFYTQKMAASFFVIGIYNETMNSGTQTHSPYFVLDEEVLPIGAAFYAAVAISYFDSQLPLLNKMIPEVNFTST
ncbi:LOW QUALITY PROTEIN: IAA-amino acid hydrolase ILR1-like 7 [Abrus precatorius]|uniref:LOW QUALITY PROTEIN: IAA-amino acid hydrolase ILR1-like 7 n=1 Tax=Abrus precatorius TaxID=3816 RepID=A0A8B8KZ56_ABRPR|nr:LOW QUALITY PROTEIN: IAA-amino acid hydrolase ILR1-like 7 [Abrus precatorius]